MTTYPLVKHEHRKGRRRINQIARSLSGTYTLEQIEGAITIARNMERKFGYSFPPADYSDIITQALANTIH